MAILGLEHTNWTTPSTKKTAPGLALAPQAATGLARPTTMANGVQYTPTNPASDLRSQTLSVAPTANREDLAKQYISNWDTAERPYFQKDVNTVVRNGAAKGQLNSGQLRTSLGDLALNEATQRQAAESNFLTQALDNSINDAYRNVGIAQQQQQYQTGLQNQTFSQALQQYLAGASGNPSSAEFTAANLAGSNAANGLSGLAGLLQSFGYGTPTPAAAPVPVPTGTPIYNTGTGVYG
jgi:hypothetical protein